MNNPDPSPFHEVKGQFSEVSSINEAPPHVVQVSQAQPGMLIKLALLQVVGTAIFSATLLAYFDSYEALSALFGGMIAAVGSMYSAVRLFKTSQNAAAVEMLVRFYVSVILKITFTLAMMAICLIVLKVSVLPFIIAYLIAAVVANLLVLLVPSRLDIVEKEWKTSGCESDNERI